MDDLDAGREPARPHLRIRSGGAADGSAPQRDRNARQHIRVVGTDETSGSDGPETIVPGAAETNSPHPENIVSQRAPAPHRRAVAISQDHTAAAVHKGFAPPGSEED